MYAKRNGIAVTVQVWYDTDEHEWHVLLGKVDEMTEVAYVLTDQGIVHRPRGGDMEATRLPVPLAFGIGGRNAKA